MTTRFQTKLTSRVLQIYFLIGILIIGGVTFYYAQSLINRIKKETEVTSRIFAKYTAGPKIDEAAIIDLLFQEVIQKIDFPVVLTDKDGNPTFWKNLKDEDVAKAIKVLDREREPIPIVVGFGSESILGYLHYGLSPFARTLRIIPFVITFFLLLFLSVGFWGYLMFKRNEEEKIWTSLAKETAHQLATPLSSLIGWIETMKGKLHKDILEGINEDARRMRAVLEKFSRIGLPPQLAEVEPRPVIDDVVHYMKRRAHRGITFSAEYGTVSNILADEILFGWAVENILKNSLDAIGSKPGQIRIRLFEQSNQVLIELSDTGPGITGMKEKEIFKPGVTTKKYGWGLGLVLARRIIEDYHKGKLVLKESLPGLTTFLLSMPQFKKTKEM